MYSAQDLADRYGITKAGLIGFVKSNLSEINKGKLNAYQTGTKKNWEFTEEAVQIIDRLRNVGSSVMERPVESEELLRLREENSNLKTTLLMTKQEVLNHKDRIIALTETAATNARLLGAAESDLKAATAEKERQQTEMEALKEEHTAVKAEADMLRKELREAQAALAAEKSKSFWQRLFG